MRFPFSARFLMPCALVLAIAGAILRVSAIEPSTPKWEVAVAEQDYDFARPNRDTLTSLASLAVRHAPFRLGATAPTVRFGSEPAAPAPAPVPLPSIAVLAIVGGPPWSALLEGLPNTDGETVVRIDDRFADIRIRTITALGVGLSNRDTSWTISLSGMPE